jgi:protein-disulfide isomerase
VSLIDNAKDVRVVLKEFPILGEGSTFAAKAAIAAKKQGKYLELHKAMLAADGKLDEARVIAIAKTVGLDPDKLRNDMQAAEIDEPIKLSHDLAGKLGINGTPTFVIGQELIPGAVGLEELKRQIANVRENGCPVC